MFYTLYRNAEIYTARDDGKPAAGSRQGDLAHYAGGALLVHEGAVAAVGSEAEVVSKVPAGATVQVIELDGRCLVPGFVDPHTHMCFAARRENEFVERLTGTPYLEILARGGGILSSVAAVAEASEKALYEMTRIHAQRALGFGTTTLEIKSGYGLDTVNELKMLNVIGKLAEEGVQDVVATFLGAHAVPPAYRDDPDGFITLLIKEMLPAVREQGIARQCDIFCEKGVFSVEQCRRLLTAAAGLGLAVKLHADEVHDLGGAGLAAELGACSADHLLAAGDDNLRAMAQAGVVATLLPATAYSLRKPYARARFMIDNGLAVALATDCNPGSSYTESMPFVIGLAMLNMMMTPAEALIGATLNSAYAIGMALIGATLNSAYAIGMADRVGSLDVGKQADFLVLDGESPAILAYHAGVSPVLQVYKKGERVA